MKYVVLAVMAIGSIAEAKPTAPVEVHIDSRAVPGGFDVTLVATPTRDVPSLELHVGSRRVIIGATRAGQVRTLSAHVTVAAGAGSDVVGSATVPVGRGIRNAVAFTRVGARLPSSHAAARPCARSPTARRSWRFADAAMGDRRARGLRWW